MLYRYIGSRLPYQHHAERQGNHFQTIRVHFRDGLRYGADFPPCRAPWRVPYSFVKTTIDNKPTIAHVWQTTCSNTVVLLMAHMYVMSLMSKSRNSTANLFLNRQQPDYVLMLKFLQDFKLSHLNSKWPQLTHLIENFESIHFSSFLK